VVPTLLRRSKKQSQAEVCATSIQKWFPAF
jgi:hypothetical protein